MLFQLREIFLEGNFLLEIKAVRGSFTENLFNVK